MILKVFILKILVLPHPNYIVDDKKKLMYLSTSLQN